MNNRGKSTKGVNLICTAKLCEGIEKDGKKLPDFVILQAQADMRSPDYKDDPHPDSFGQTFTGKDGKTYTGHGFRITVSQYNKMIQAAGDGNAKAITPDGKTVAFTLKADLMKAKQPGAHGYIINSAGPMGPSDYGWTDNMLDMQKQSIADARAARDEARASKSAEAEAVTPVAVPMADGVEPEQKAEKAATKKTATKKAPARKKAAPKAKAPAAQEVETPSVDDEFEG